MTANDGDVTLLTERKVQARFVHPGHHTDAMATDDAKDGASNEAGKMNAPMLFAVLFSMAIGGGYGTEDLLRAGGPLMTVLMLFLLPLFWGLPTALASTELATAVRANAGPSMWVNVAVPPPVAFGTVLLSLFLMFAGNSVPPALLVSYCTAMWPNLGIVAQIFIKLGCVALSTFLNIVGVEVVGWAAVAVAAFTVSPFIILSAIVFIHHGIDWSLIGTHRASMNFPVFFSILTWNISYLEMVGTLTEDVRKPHARTVFRGITPMVLAYWIAYIIPMLAGVTAMNVIPGGTYLQPTHADGSGPMTRQIAYSNWTAGYWNTVAHEIGGDGMRIYMLIGGMVSAFGYELGGQCTTSRALAGMGQMGVYPGPISRFLRVYSSRFGTPRNAILVNGFVAACLTLALDFDNLVAITQTFYCLRLSMVYVALFRLRIKWPHLVRPFVFPGPGRTTAGLAVVFVVPFCVVYGAATMSATINLPTALTILGALIGIAITSFLYTWKFLPNGIGGRIEEFTQHPGGGDDASPSSPAVNGDAPTEETTLTTSKRPDLVKRSSHLSAGPGDRVPSDRPPPSTRSSIAPEEGGDELARTPNTPP